MFLYAQCRYITLEVKNILLESVLHHILPQMLNSPFLQHAADLAKDYLKFMDDHLKESADLTCLAYRHRTYSKVSGSFYCSPVPSAWNPCKETHNRTYMMLLLSLPRIQMHQSINRLFFDLCKWEILQSSIQTHWIFFFVR